MRKKRERRWFSHLLYFYKASVTGDAVKSFSWRVGGRCWFWLQLAFTSLCFAAQYGLTFMGPEARAPKAELLFSRQMPELFGVLFHFMTDKCPLPQGSWNYHPVPTGKPQLTWLRRWCLAGATRWGRRGCGLTFCVVQDLLEKDCGLPAILLTWKESKKVRVDPSAAAADILSLKHIFFWIPEIKGKFRNSILKFMNCCS